MKIRDDLVYHKHDQEIVGFVDLGSVDNELQSLENSAGRKQPVARLCPAVATHILVLMVRGIATSLRFPWAHFPTTGVTASSLMSIMWEAIEILEFLGFKVLAITSDGAGPNRKFYRLHDAISRNREEPLYKVPNPYSCEGRMIYFMSDAPHLIKTTRNCLSHSFPFGKIRAMKVRN